MNRRTDRPARSIRPVRSVLVRASLLAAVALVLPQQGPASADTPPAPSAGEVQQAQDAASAAQSAVDAVAAQLTAAQTAEAAMNVKAETAVEAYNGAVLTQQRAAAAAAAAIDASNRADNAADDARDTVGSMAAEQYRDGGPIQLAGFAGLLSAEDPESAALARQATDGAAADARETLRTAEETATVAAEAYARARQANEVATAAEVKVNTARAQALQQLAAQQVQVTALDAQRTQLLSGLADAQRTALQLTEARAAALAAQAARAAALQRQQAQQAAAAAAAAVAPASGNVSGVLAFAQAALGRPYVWGGAGPDTYDCSGLTMRAWQRAGVDLPHFAADQYADSHPLTYGQLRPGDLVFWSHDGAPDGIYHVALYIGSDTIIEAPHTGAVVKTASLWIMGTPDFYARP